MDFDALLNLAKKGASLLSQGRQAFEQVKDAVNDGKTAINATQRSELESLLAQEEQETKSAIADARDAIAEYRRG